MPSEPSYTGTWVRAWRRESSKKPGIQNALQESSISVLKKILPVNNLGISTSQRESVTRFSTLGFFINQSPLGP
jgi:hypothetical protein